MTSSLRNSIHRRNHKERSQLAHRSKFGILEKHADYVKRARDYHSKQDRLTRLKQKAAERNKDEFYFSMTREKTKDGVHVQDRGNVALPTDIVKVLKTQDENYIRTMRAAGLKKIDKLKNQLMALADLVKPGSLAHGTDDGDENELEDEEFQVLQDAGIVSRSSKFKGKGRRKPKHVIFVENEEEARQYVKGKRSLETSSDARVEPQEVVRDLGWKVQNDTKQAKRRSKSSPETNGEADAGMMNVAEERSLQAISNRRRLLKELSARLTRDKQLRYAQRELEMQRLLMGKGSRKKLRGVEQVEGEDDDHGEDEDEIDARKGKSRRSVGAKVDEGTYKPRVYKWRLERKR